ncbi:MAG: pyruvate, phosphate dikinase [Elusimicrobia bacterium RIFCSPLOWO2_02_FULL_39_32]|nr:MAG: pyruvate, phosphate dikinase [Elusimicrobia bacterium GWA2_38_7]OGR78237.1 MAG: pyruvate, phosphate dikinase [Elusimicrobia bacterium RIFCSPHIGHO2_02_FULL_39_36]OGR92375.1 MAG: pyruvate, phosphate dikinase [Elusimicrobia bacterium RIFCSPLOWO2_02_FULL_39_32]OGR98918.1 MAG: pyruvate, phosphate dikinase [Elusimicrobia bacterium RIFCSPLOWO2_12_FULL_39_28]
MAKKYVYFFGAGKADGNGKMKDLLGGKGAGLAEMSKSGVPVPPGFTITTDTCRYYYAHGRRVPPELNPQFKTAMQKLEKVSGKKFGDQKNPLLVSVRSGAKFSMPGMMDTILNLGINDAVIDGLITLTNNPRFVWDSYRRFIQMFGNVVMGIEKSKFEQTISQKKQEKGVTADTQLDAEDLKDLVSRYKEKYKEETKEDFPQDPWKQLVSARDAVFKSWNNERAISYRRLNKISDDLGTAVNVQTMVFGNMGTSSATGVGFTRNPSSGKKEFFGEYLTNAQGEDVVAGVRTPNPIRELQNEIPKCYDELKKITSKLERHYRDVQDFEFTIEREKLYMLQTRTGKRTGMAAVKIAVDMVHEKVISKAEAILRVEPDQLSQLLAPVFDEKEKVNAVKVAKGINAGPGAASGRIAFTAAKAVDLAKQGPVVLVRPETNPDDIEGMNASVGILTAIGGRTSHAAVVARGMGKPCIVGCSDLKIDEHSAILSVDGHSVKEGESISIDGFTGEVFIGLIPTLPSEVVRVLNGEMNPKESELFQIFKEFMKWADQIRTLKVRANADIPRDAKAARWLGAEGIGLCRTEHMFFAEERLPYMQQMILANNIVDRKKALDALLPFQKEDFKGLFREMRGFPVTIRTLDPPLHEFLPKTETDAQALSQKIGVPTETIWAKSKELHEFNPMLGHRGCRLGITYPEITEMQVKAIISAACELAKEKIRVVPEIMIPLVGHKNELKHQKELAIQVAKETMKSYGVKVNYLIGTMIEVPRAAMVAGSIAEEAEFFSFGTNDLTQMGFGFSRDDAGKFIPTYLAEKILKEDPFQTLDQEGIGRLIQYAAIEGRKTKKDLKLGICGEHGGDPESVKFCYRTGLNYVSCSPYRIPIARLAAAQALLQAKQKTEYTSK